jgi:AcrR family transcriptional regulator
MVQKGEKRPRGRPREYDPHVALQRAREAFWDAGFSGTSLDDLSDSTGMNRPSLYAAFGDKQALYLKTLKAYHEDRRALLEAIFRPGRPAQESLRAFCGGMIDRFLDGDRGARGCYMVGTAVTEAVGNPQVREILAQASRHLEHVFHRVFAGARDSGEVGPDADPEALAIVATALVHTLALRARSGQPRAALQRVADATLKLIFPARAAPKKKRS